MRKQLTILAHCTALFCAVFHSHGQGTFQNLDFESANVPDIPQGQNGGFVPTNQALPGWSAYLGGNQVNEIGHNGFSTGGAIVSIQGPHWLSSQILQGQYTVSLAAVYNPLGVPGFTDDAAIGQTGQIPLGAKSLIFLTDPFNTLQTSFAGQAIPLDQLGANNNYVILG